MKKELRSISGVGIIVSTPSTGAGSELDSFVHSSRFFTFILADDAALCECADRDVWHKSDGRKRYVESGLSYVRVDCHFLPCSRRTENVLYLRTLVYIFFYDRCCSNKKMELEENNASS